MKSGVYTITNTVNGKMYVGSAQRYFSSRWSDHRRKLRSNTHYNDHLQRSWNKYGEESFRFEILETYPPEYCLQMEYYWVNLLDTVSNGYNADYPGLGTTGFRFGKSTKAKMSAKAKLRDQSHLHTQEVWKKISESSKTAQLGNTNRRGTGKYGKCEKYDSKWNLVHTYDNPYQAFRDLGLNHASHIIRSSINSTTCKGFHWVVYNKEGNLIE